MPRRSLLNEGNEETEINLSPMIDCIFILLIFFIVTTVFVEEPAVEIEKPVVALEEPLEKNSIIVAISADNKVVYGGREVGISGAGARIRQLLAKDDLPVIIQANAPVLRLLRGVGLRLHLIVADCLLLLGAGSRTHELRDDELTAHFLGQIC